MKTSTMGAGQFVEFILTRERKKHQDDVNCGNRIFFKVPKIFFEFIFYSLLKLHFPLRRSYLHFKICISAVHIVFNTQKGVKWS